MMLNTNAANITVYYTNEILTNESTEDLNGDGDTDDVGVPVKTKQSTVFQLAGIRTAVFMIEIIQLPHVLMHLLIYPNRFRLMEKKNYLYLEHAGSIIEMDLFDGEDLQGN